MNKKMLILILSISFFLFACSLTQGKSPFYGQESPSVAENNNETNEKTTPTHAILINWDIPPLPTPTTDDAEDFIFSVLIKTSMLSDHGYLEDAVVISSLLEDFYNNGPIVDQIDESAWEFYLKTQIAASLNNICWTGAINNQPSIVMDTCNTAVDFEPEIGATRDSRGIALALSGEAYYQKAIEDFSFFLDWYDSLSESGRETFSVNDQLAAHRVEWINQLKQGKNPINAAELSRLKTEEDLNNMEIMGFSEEDQLLGLFGPLLFFEHYSDVFENISKLEAYSDIDVVNLWHAACISGSIHGDAAEVMIACEKAVELSPAYGEYFDGRGIARALTGDFEGGIKDLEASIEYLITQVENPDIKEYVRVGYYQISIPDYERWIEGLSKGDIPFTQGDINNLSFPIFY